jgi:hypothetical protein
VSSSFLLLVGFGFGFGLCSFPHILCIILVPPHPFSWLALDGSALVRMKPVAVALATPVAGLTSQQCMFASTCGNWLVGGGGGGGGGGQLQQQQQYRLSCSSLSSCSQVQFVNASLCSVTTCGNGAGHSLVVQEVSAAASHRMAVQSCDSSFAAGCSGLRRVGRGMDSGGRLNGGGCGHYRLARLRCLGSGDLSNNNNNNSSNGPSERASRRDGASEGEAETGNSGGMEEEVASSSVWDLQARRKRMQVRITKFETICLCFWMILGLRLAIPQLLVDSSHGRKLSKHITELNTSCG